MKGQCKMAKKIYTKEELTAKTNAELRQICKTQKIPGMTKKRKDIIVDAILMRQGGEAASTPKKKAEKQATSIAPNNKYVASVADDKDKVMAATFTLNSVMTKPNAKVGDKTTTTIRVSCGASYGDFPVVGKTVSGVKNFLKEVLNISTMSSPLVNGKQVEETHVIKESDEVEFLKPAGQKG